MVKKGEPVLAFDTEELQRLLSEKQAELQEAAKKLEQKEIELGLKPLELDQQAAQAQADLGKAELKAEVPAELLRRVELQRPGSTRRGASAISKTSTRRPGHPVARRRGSPLAPEPARPGPRARRGAPGRDREDDGQRPAGRHRGLPDELARREEEGRRLHVVRRDRAGHSRPHGDAGRRLGGRGRRRRGGGGQKIVLRLEARPDLDFRGRVRSVGRTVRQKSWRTPGKIVRVEVELERTDPAVMRPAMRFRGEIETGRTEGPPARRRATRCSCAMAGRSCACGAPWAGARCRCASAVRNRRLVEVVTASREGDRLARRPHPADRETRQARAVLVSAEPRPRPRRRRRSSWRRALAASRRCSWPARASAVRSPTAPSPPSRAGRRSCARSTADGHPARRSRPRRIIGARRQCAAAAEGRVPGRATAPWSRRATWWCASIPRSAENEAADGQADLAPRSARSSKPEPRAARPERLARLRPRRGPRRARPRPHLRAQGPASSISRHQIIESQLDRELCRREGRRGRAASRGERQAVRGGAGLGRDRGGEGAASG